MSSGKSIDCFDIKKTNDFFQSTLIDDEDIHIGSYLEAYKELNKFCSLLGTKIFYFVSAEIQSKSDVMHELIKNNKTEHFDTLKNMIEYEKSSNLFCDKKYVSGCRTLLRLHRGLDFIRTFLRRISELQLEDNTSKVGSEAYDETLGKYHPWLIKQAAFIAMKFLPTKQNMMVSVCGKDFEEATEVLPLMIQAADEVYNRTQQCYETHELLDLP